MPLLDDTARTICNITDSSLCFLNRTCCDSNMPFCEQDQNTLALASYMRRRSVKVRFIPMICVVEKSVMVDMPANNP